MSKFRPPRGKSLSNRGNHLLKAHPIAVNFNAVGGGPRRSPGMCSLASGQSLSQLGPGERPSGLACAPSCVNADKPLRVAGVRPRF